jgi:putative NIF3 family GTP cyclohydrolase 1 type 2
LQLLDYAAIAHLFLHAPLDAADFGTSATLLKLTGCSEIGKFDPEHPNGWADTSADFFWGRYGELDMPEPFNVFERKVSLLLGEAPRMALTGSGMVQRVATVTGAGSAINELKEAVDLGCDTYITGELSLYFLMYARYQKLNVLVYSHTGTEIAGVEALVRRLVEDYPEVTFTRLDEERL